MFSEILFERNMNIHGSGLLPLAMRDIALGAICSEIALITSRKQIRLRFCWAFQPDHIATNSLVLCS